MTSSSSSSSIYEPGNIMLVLICIMIIGIIIKGDTVFKVPRYYAIEVRTKDGGKKWIYINADEADKDPDKDKTLWEPPCLASEKEGAVVNVEEGEFEYVYVDTDGKYFDTNMKPLATPPPQKDLKENKEVVENA